MNCVILIPVYKSMPDDCEVIALRQCKKVLGKYPMRLLAPRGLDIRSYVDLFNGVSDFGHCYFPGKYFKSPQTYNRFMKSLLIYKAFRQFDYFLMYHTDAFVFRDELAYWCEKGYDYIGAPIYEYDGTTRPTKFLGVGNSGFSLHKISAKLQVLTTLKQVYFWRDFLRWYRQYNWKGKLVYAAYMIRMLFRLGGWSHHLLNFSLLNEDIFWGIQVPARFPEFKVSSFDDARCFSVEYNCEMLIHANGGVMPFGCHGWSKPLFIDFWKPFIEAHGYTIG